MATSAERQTGDEYAVRWYEPGDREGILSLYEVEWGRSLDAEWFDWKYVDDPYLSHVPITVAERDGEIVGTQAYVPFPLRWRNESALALQPADAMVHPDHRRNGLYTRMTELAIDRYVDHEAALFFNYPNPGALRAQQGMGWSSVGTVGTSYRVQHPERLAGDDASGVKRTVAKAAGPLARTALSAGERLAPRDDEIEVRRQPSVPTETLAALYESDVPDAVHVRRDPELYDWWFADPSREYHTYVGQRDGAPAAAIVTRTDGDQVKLVDAVARPRASTDAYGSVLAAIVADRSDATLLAVSGTTLPRSLLAAFGFVSDETPLLARFCTQTNVAVRPLGADSASPREDGEDCPIPPSVLTDRERWRITFTEQDRN